MIVKLEETSRNYNKRHCCSVKTFFYLIFQSKVLICICDCNIKQMFAKTAKKSDKKYFLRSEQHDEVGSGTVIMSIAVVIKIKPLITPSLTSFLNW